MTEERGLRDTITRRFDDGAELVLRGLPREDGVMEGLALQTAHCTDPACPCRDVSVVAWYLEWPAGGGEPRQGNRPLRATVDLDSGAVSPESEVAPDSQDAGMLELLRKLLAGDPLDLVRDRWRRVKRLDDPDEWRHVDWGEIDVEWLVPYCQIFPSRWDLSVIRDQTRYWVMDAWCLRPGCPCTELGVELLGEAGRSVGALRVDARSGRVIGARGQTPARRLWEQLMAEPDTRRILAARREDVRRVARQLPEHLAATRPPITALVGRNQPCPCGSGKKYKRCCGRRGS